MSNLSHAHHHLPSTDELDLKQLRLLSNAHFVLAGLSLLLLVGLVLLPLFMGPAYFRMMHWTYSPAALALLKESLVAKLMNGGLQTLIFALNGWSLRHHQNRISCLILSVFECLSLPPFGLILGIYGIRILQRESVKAIFDHAKSHEPGCCNP